METDVTFRFANSEDLETILDFIKALAEYEKLENEVIATPELLNEWIFEKDKAEVIFALANDKEVGFALFFHNFSTFLGRAGIYLEDLFVKPEFRGKGIGKALLIKLSQITVERGYGSLRWQSPPSSSTPPNLSLLACSLTLRKVFTCKPLRSALC